jgi:leader peptidase (prepilin peptidase)/N-methyltransferase
VTTSTSPAAAVAAGGTIGLLISILLWWRGILPTSFPKGEPMLEVDREALAEEIEQAKREKRDPAELPEVPPSYTSREVRREMRKEMLFLLPPMALGLLWAVLTARVPALNKMWQQALAHDWLSGLLGSLLGGLVGAGVVWVTRILGTLGFGRLAMGLGDADLMFGVGAVLGAGPAVIAFFTAPFFGLLIAVYLLITGKRREVPYGPYLSLASAFVLLFFTPVVVYLAPGLAFVSSWLCSLLRPGP